MTDKILIVGAGGIGSHCASELYNDIMIDQIDLMKYSITVADPDIAVQKNLRYQNFQKDDLGRNKAEAIAKRYGFDYINKRIENDEQLKPFKIIISCVDNVKARKLIFEHCFKENKYFLDLRAEGKIFAFYTKDNNNLQKLLKTLPDSDEDGSCQLQRDLDNGIIQKGNKIIAQCGSQLLLNHLRDEKNPSEMVLRI